MYMNGYQSKHISEVLVQYFQTRNIKGIIEVRKLPNRHMFISNLYQYDTSRTFPTHNLEFFHFDF